MKIGEIEHGIQYVHWSLKYDNLICGLEIGDSRLVTFEAGETPKKKINSVRSYLNHACKKRGIVARYKVRMMSGESGFRVWRIG